MSRNRISNEVEKAELGYVQSVRPQMHWRCPSLDILEMFEFRGIADPEIFNVYDGLRGGTSVWFEDETFFTLQLGLYLYLLRIPYITYFWILA